MEYVVLVDERDNETGVMEKLEAHREGKLHRAISVFIFNSKNEMVGQRRIWRGPGHFRVCSATSYHRIELDPGVTAWTLFMPGPHRREWGFLVGRGENQKWEHNESYLTRRSSTQTV